MKEPVDHVLRPRLPWRDADAAPITECGYDATKVKTLTRAEFAQRLKEWGSQRTAIVTCMTCADTARRWGGWEDDPRHALQREIEWEGVSRWGGRDQRGTRLRDELIVIAEMIEAHRAEFDQRMAANASRREWLEKKAALKQRPKPQPAKRL
ncbi:MAG: hypothetical protein AB7P12_09870 [Alphaproteobacteria bacterium]